MRRHTLFTAMLLAGFCLAAGPVAGQEKGATPTKEYLDLPYDAIGDTGPDEEGPIEKITFLGQTYEGDGFFFCCDRSGSMKDAVRFRRLQQEVVKNVSQFTREVQFGIVFFDVAMMKFPESGQPAEASSPMKAAAIARVLSSQPGNGTCAKPALQAALTFANQSTVKRKVIIYLSDGRNTCPGFDAAKYGEDILGMVRALNSQRVPINVIGISPQSAFEEQWLRRLALENRGTYARLN